MKRSELLEILKAHGCYFWKHGKKHDRWYSPITKRKFSVPRHLGREVPPGTLDQILKDAGIKG